MSSAEQLWARVQAAEKQAQAALDKYEAFGVRDPSSEGSPQYEQAHADCHAAWVNAEGARHDLDAFLNPERYAQRGYMAEALDRFRTRSEPDTTIHGAEAAPGEAEPETEAEAGI